MTISSSPNTSGVYALSAFFIDSAKTVLTEYSLPSEMTAAAPQSFNACSRELPLSLKFISRGLYPEIKIAQNISIQSRLLFILSPTTEPPGSASVPFSVLAKRRISSRASP